jgi:hypothetical protein
VRPAVATGWYRTRLLRSAGTADCGQRRAPRPSIPARSAGGAR